MASRHGVTYPSGLICYPSVRSVPSQIQQLPIRPKSWEINTDTVSFGPVA